MMNNAVAEAPPTTIIYPLSAIEARQLTNEIRDTANSLRKSLLKFYDGQGWSALGYDSFKAWAIAEFQHSFQHAYKLIGVARIENDLSIVSGQDVEVSVNVGKQLAAVPEHLRLEAYNVAKTHAETMNREITEKDAIKAVKVVKKRDFVNTSKHHVLVQMVNEGAIAVDDAEMITKELNKSSPKTIVYAQEKMALGLRDAKIILKIIKRHRDYVRTGEVSRNLTEIDTTGRIAGVPLDRASYDDWKRMASQHQADIIAEEKERKRQAEQAKAEAEGEEYKPVEPKPMNAYTNSPEQTLDALKMVLSDETLDGLFQLMAQERGYVASSTVVSIYAQERDTPVTGDSIPLSLSRIPRNGLECKQYDHLELLMRVSSKNNQK